MESIAKMLPISGPAGKAAVLAIGTATGPHALDQRTLPEDYFRVTNSEQMVELKDKFRRICKCILMNYTCHSNILIPITSIKTPRITLELGKL